MRTVIIAHDKNFVPLLKMLGSFSFKEEVLKIKDESEITGSQVKDAFLISDKPVPEHLAKEAAQVTEIIFPSFEGTVEELDELELMQIILGVNVNTYAIR